MTLPLQWGFRLRLLGERQCERLPSDDILHVLVPNRHIRLSANRAAGDRGF